MNVCFLPLGAFSPFSGRLAPIPQFLKPEHLQQLGMHYKIFVISGVHFRCANARERLVLVGFLDQAHLERFSPPQAWCEIATPIRSVLKNYSVDDEVQLFLKVNQMEQAAKMDRAHVCDCNVKPGGL